MARRRTYVRPSREGELDRRSFIIGSRRRVPYLSAQVGAQDGYPAHAITIINPFPPGGASDVVTRPLAAALEPIVRKPVVVDTKARRGRTSRRASRRPCQAGRLHAAFAHHVDLRLCRGRPAVRSSTEIHQRRFHSACAVCRRPLRADRQRPTTVEDAAGVRRGRQEAAERDHLQLVRPLRRAAHPVPLC